MSITEQTQNQPVSATNLRLELYEGAMCCETGVCGPASMSSS